MESKSRIYKDMLADHIVNRGYTIFGNYVLKNKLYGEKCSLHDYNIDRTFFGSNTDRQKYDLLVPIFYKLSETLYGRKNSLDKFNVTTSLLSILSGNIYNNNKSYDIDKLDNIDVDITGKDPSELIKELKEKFKCNEFGILYDFNTKTNKKILCCPDNPNNKEINEKYKKMGGIFQLITILDTYFKINLIEKTSSEINIPEYNLQYIEKDDKKQIVWFNNGDKHYLMPFTDSMKKELEYNERISQMKQFVSIIKNE